MIPERVEILHLANFLVVAETGSFRKAATRLNLGQSAVSRRVQRLEDLLGLSLFERRPSGARLTEAGARFAFRARAILDEVDDAIENARNAAIGGIGQLRIGLIASVSKGAFRDLLKGFKRDHPDVDVIIVTASRSELLTQLSHRQIDAVYAAGEPADDIGDGLVLTRELVFLAVPSDGAVVGQGALTWDNLSNLRFVVSARGLGPEVHDYILQRVGDVGGPTDVRRHRLGREGIMTLVGLGFGAALVADHWRGVTYPNVSFLEVSDPVERVPFTLSWNPENDNPALRRFVSRARVIARDYDNRI